MKKSHFEVQISDPSETKSYRQNKNIHVMCFDAAKAIELTQKGYPEARVINVLHRGTFEFLEENNHDN